MFVDTKGIYKTFEIILQYFAWKREIVLTNQIRYISYTTKESMDIFLRTHILLNGSVEDNIVWRK